MKVAIEEFIKDVRVAIDMNRRDESLAGAGDLDTLELDEAIRSKICDGIDLTHQESPLMLLEPKDIGGYTNGTISLDGRGVGRITLPEDFLRFVYFHLYGWQQGVYEAYYPGDPRFDMQGSRWAGIYGTKERPAVTIEPRTEGLILSFYSGTPNAEHGAISTALYIPRATITEEEEVEVSRGCYRSAVYRTAGLVLAGYGDELSGVMIKQSEGMLG
ncbi:MAG: hypothetical protein J1D77_03655 [Muribaculaceae bacterium]|nr:hypothetical protein [Muribaculaceae bacterium]